MGARTLERKGPAQARTKSDGTAAAVFLSHPTRAEHAGTNTHAADVEVAAASRSCALIVTTARYLLK
jgi:hypothetical protein